MACGLNHTLVVSADGMMVWAFGDGDYGKLGLGNSTAKSSPQVCGRQVRQVRAEFTPPAVSFQKVDVLCGLNIKKVACGTQFSVALTRDGRVFTFGQGQPPLLLTSVLSRLRPGTTSLPDPRPSDRATGEPGQEPQPASASPGPVGGPSPGRGCGS